MTTENQGSCPLCEGSGEIRINMLKGYKAVQCELCKQFRITSHAEHWLLQDKHGTRSRLSEKVKNAPDGSVLLIDVVSSSNPETHNVGSSYVAIDS